MMEAAVLIDHLDRPIYWHTPANRTMVSLPDSRDLWDAIWEKRAWLHAIAHTHPGSGLTLPSNTDLTTFDAVDKALGRRLNWLIATQTDLVQVRRVHISSLGYQWVTEPTSSSGHEHWLRQLRLRSYTQGEG